MSMHTSGPWTLIEQSPPRIIKPGQYDICEMTGAASSAGVMADARLIAAAPAMAMCLELVTSGLARIVVTGTLVEFAFCGIRYCHNGDWSKLLDVIGWDKARAAIAKAEGKA